jgi:hypothetical protein
LRLEVTLKLILALTLAAAPAFVTRPGPQADLSTVKMTRARSLAGLRSCARNPRGTGCSDYSSDFLINLYWRERADAEVLKVLLDAEPYGDGALAEGLGAFYSEMLERRPRVFLRAISGRPARERRSLCTAAGITDGSGMSDATLRAVRANLNRIARERRAPLATVARDCWADASAGDRRTKSQ